MGADGKTVEGLDADLAQALAGAHGPEGAGPARDVRQHPAGADDEEVRRRHVGASRTRRSARRPSTSSPTSRPARRSSSRRRRAARWSTRSTTSAASSVAAAEGHRAGRGRRGPAGQVRGRRQARDQGHDVPRPAGREPGDRRRPRRRRHDRLARRRLPGQAVGRAALQLVGEQFGSAPYGIALPKGSCARQADARGHEGADRRRHLRRDPRQVRASRPARSPSPASTRPTASMMQPRSTLVPVRRTGSLDRRHRRRLRWRRRWCAGRSRPIRASSGARSARCCSPSGSCTACS